MAAREKDRRVPESRQLFETAVKAAEWASRQLDTARLLLGSENWAMALAVAALGLEEVGRSVLCQTMLAMPPIYRQEARRDFWRAFTNHDAKDQLANFALRVFLDDRPLPSSEVLLSEVGAAAKRVNDEKFRALYVAFNEDGSVWSPTQVTQGEACAVVDLLDRVYTTMSERQFLLTAGEGESEGYLDFVSQVHASLNVDTLTASLGDDLAEAFETLRTAMHSGAAPPTWLVDLLPAEFTAAFAAELDAGDSATEKPEPNA